MSISSGQVYQMVDALKLAHRRALDQKYGLVDALVRVGKHDADTARYCIEKFDKVCEEEQTLEHLVQVAEKLQEEIDRLQKNLDLNYRCRMHWRVLASKVCLGIADIETLKAAVFHELIGNVPTEEILTRQLHEVAELMGQREQAADEFGPLRVINLNKDIPCDSPTPAAPAASSSPPGP